jgi:Rps23 Pro-64 3,4-dihydroxylase Tpa1-like proline 4-hydroxylase
MRQIFNEDYLFKLAEENRDKYVNAEPFPHIVIDNFVEPKILDGVLESFPTSKDLDFYKYDNQLERKLAFDQVSKLPDPIYNILTQMNSAVFISFLEKLTGIEGIIPDPYYRGGGIHQIEKGGKLDVHIDFNIHTKFKLHRRLNVLIYLNKDWEAEYGGNFELWSGHKDENGKHVIEECMNKILPLFNRFVVFSTSEKSYHGHPEPLNCPEGRSRKSLALYFYTNGREDEFKNTPAHSTTFIKRPEDPDNDDLNELRETRNKGRLTSNVKSDLTAS